MLTVIHSRVHDGKTTEIINRIGELMRQGKRSVLIVPDQVTYAAERDICSQLGISGFSLCQVMSFNRFCEAVLRSAGKKCPRRLTDAGRMAMTAYADGIMLRMRKRSSAPARREKLQNRF